MARRSDTTVTSWLAKCLLAEGAAHGLARRRQRDAEQARLVELLDGVVVGAVEVAAQQAVAGVALLLDDAQHAPHRHADQRERMAREHQRSLDRLGHHLGRAGGAQALEVGVVDRSHDDRNLRRVRMREVQDLQRRLRVVVADDDRCGAREPRGHQALQARRVAEHDALAGGRGLAHAIRVEVERDVGDLLGFEQARQVLAAAAEAADDDVPLGVDRAPRDRRHRDRLEQPVVGREAHDDPVAVRGRSAASRASTAPCWRAPGPAGEEAAAAARSRARAGRSRTRRPAPGRARCAARRPASRRRRARAA